MDVYLIANGPSSHSNVNADRRLTHMLLTTKQVSVRTRDTKRTKRLGLTFKGECTLGCPPRFFFTPMMHRDPRIQFRPQRLLTLLVSYLNPTLPQTSDVDSHPARVTAFDTDHEFDAVMVSSSVATRSDTPPHSDFIPLVGPLVCLSLPPLLRLT